MNPDVGAPFAPYADYEFLVVRSVEEFAGPSTTPKTPPLADLLSMPLKIDNLTAAVSALVQCDNLCDELLQRALNASTSSRLVLQMEIISLITGLFTELLPVPVPLDSDESRTKTCIWRNNGMILKEVQIAALERIHKLALKFASMWQAIERPTRDFDSERGLVVSSMLCIFDIMTRQIAVTDPLILSELLWEDGGYGFSTTVRINQRPFWEVRKERDGIL